MRKLPYLKRHCLTNNVYSTKTKITCENERRQQTKHKIFTKKLVVYWLIYQNIKCELCKSR